MDLGDFFLVVNADRTILERAPEFLRNGPMPAATDGTAPAEAIMAEGARTVAGQAAVKRATITADQLTGVRVYGPKDEDAGEISELVLDTNGSPPQVIVDVGGFLGMGEKPVAFEMTALHILKATEGGALRAYIQMTQDQLETLPAAKM